jgi:hypothetical protein
VKKSGEVGDHLESIRIDPGQVVSDQPRDVAFQRGDRAGVKTLLTRLRIRRCVGYGSLNNSSENGPKTGCAVAMSPPQPLARHAEHLLSISGRPRSRPSGQRIHDHHPHRRDPRNEFAANGGVLITPAALAEQAGVSSRTIDQASGLLWYRMIFAHRPLDERPADDVTAVFATQLGADQEG